MLSPALELRDVIYGAACFFAVRSLRSIDTSIKVLFEHHEALEKEHNELKGDFKEMKGRCDATPHPGGRRGYDPTERVAA